MNRYSLEENEIKELRQQTIEHIWQVTRPFNVFSAPRGFTIFTDGQGCHVTDVNGKTYLDFWANIMLNNVGYGRKEIADAAYEQLKRLPFAPTHEPTIPRIKLAKRLADITPGTLSKVFLGSGGSESIETALKIAWKYQRLLGFTNRYKMVGGYTYHGSTFGAMSTGWRPPFFSWEDFPPLLPGMVHITSPYCSVCDFGLEYPNCDILCAKYVEKIIQLEGPDTVAAFIDVTIPTSAHIPPKEYWSIIRSICDKYGILLILDCVQSGFGRFGYMFACEHYNIVPDIMVVSKALASGYQPISATIVKKEVAQKFEGGPAEVLSHSYTFEGHPVACAASLANLEIIEKENLVENSRMMGDYLFEQLQLLYRHKIVGEIRGGLGLNCAVELVRDRKSKKRFSKEENDRVCGLLQIKLMEAGLFGLFTNPLPIVPALIINKDEIDLIATGLNQVIAEIQKEIIG
jgi:adenosylmethionine-8-amino-7-oxononanoate aminotransferase